MNPAALKTNLPDLPKGGTLIVNTDEFNERNLTKAGYASEPARGRLARRLPRLQAPDHDLTGTREARAETSSPQGADRCKNFFALG
jgi:2-oxoglutarate ferredoxin oxidoreductase subunit alpha